VKGVRLVQSKCARLPVRHAEGGGQVRGSDGTRTRDLRHDRRGREPRLIAASRRNGTNCDFAGDRSTAGLPLFPSGVFRSLSPVAAVAFVVAAIVFLENAARVRN
jgi:hypothetical protein